MILAQQQASDQWSFYQAKVLREHFYQGQKIRLEAELFERKDSMKPGVKERFKNLLKKMGAILSTSRPIFIFSIISAVLGCFLSFTVF